jgi:hypothetical protein
MWRSANKQGNNVECFITKTVESILPRWPCQVFSLHERISHFFLRASCFLERVGYFMFTRVTNFMFLNLFISSCLFPIKMLHCPFFSLQSDKKMRFHFFSFFFRAIYTYSIVHISSTTIPGPFNVLYFFKNSFNYLLLFSLRILI